MTRRLIALAIVLAAVSACGKKTSPSSPSSDTTYRFVATMSANQEVPPVTNADANATGTATITFNVTRNSSGTITAGTVDFVVTLAGFPTGTVLTAAHIHPGFTGGSGGVSVSTGLANGEVTLPTGSGGFTKTGVTLPSDVAASVIANPQGFYFNVHTTLNTGGAVRGQLVKQ